MVQSVLHVLLECFTNLTDRTEKHSVAMGHCVSVMMGLFELMMPRHYQELRKSLLGSAIPGVDLGVRSCTHMGREGKRDPISKCQFNSHFGKLHQVESLCRLFWIQPAHLVLLWLLHPLTTGLFIH